MTSTPAAARPLCSVSALALGEEPWEAPAPLSGQRTVLPAFPIEVLPGWLGDYVAGVAVETQTPPDLAGCIGLAAVSTAAGGRAVVQVRGRWREPVNIYTVVALPPGSRKSAVFAAMIRPLLDVERAMVAEAKPQIAEAELLRRVAEARAEKAAKAALSGDPETIANASTAAVAIGDITVPAVPQLIADDVTVEAATSLLAEQGGRLAILSPEGGIFTTMAGRYSGVTNFEVFLKGHAGDLLRVGRKGRQAEHIDQPALTLGLSPQPKVVADLAAVPGFRDLGLLARILWSLPPDLVGHRQIGPECVSDTTADAYLTTLRALTVTLAGWTDPAVLALTPDAARLVLQLETTTEPKLADGAEWAAIRDWGSKYIGATIRLAALLHFGDHPEGGWQHPITEHTMARAQTLGRYYAAHALAAFDLIGTDPLTEDARAILAWIGRTHPAKFTRRDAFAANRTGRIRTVTDIDPALDLLEQHGHIRRAPEVARTGPGRPPSPTYHVHPNHHATTPAATIPGAHR
jgi:hypothetical protein